VKMFDLISFEKVFINDFYE